MFIKYHSSSKEFHLSNGNISYLMTVLKNGHLGQLYFGKAIRDQEDYSHLLELRPRPMAPCAYKGDLAFSLEHIKQEYPSYGSGDMRDPAFTIEMNNGSRISDFVYQSHVIYQGKKKLEGLPATYVESDEEALTLEITLVDEVAKVEMLLSYTIFKEYDVIARNTKFICHHEDGVKLDRAMSLSLDLPDAAYEMLEFTGAWARERNMKKRKLTHGIQSVYSMRGCSSSNYNPFIILKRENADENQGEVLGFSLVYSGNFLAQVEVDTYEVSRVMLGIHPNNFSWVLNKNESFQTPEALLTYSRNGLNGMSQQLHHLFQKRLARGEYRDQPRPILVNNWEGTYFDFNEEKILNIARTAKKLGIEMFVLDDGWFGKRNDDHSSLGDWYPNLEKLPNGITGLANKITEMGLKFGLWFEPEMTNEDSDLYRAHPDWILSTPNRRVSHGRNQYILDFSRKEVVDSIGDMMEKILSEAPISYVKWDMNRCMSEVYSHDCLPMNQGKVMHQYILGVYALYERLIQKFPHILFESCASGGARFDAGMLYYAPQAWTSDDTDAIERLKIQYGTSYGYPISSMGSHVSAIPNHQTFRNVPLCTRANVAYFGTFGYELDLNKLSEVEQEQVIEQVKWMKEYRNVIQYGDFYRLVSPFEKDGNVTSWMVVSKDKSIALVGYYRTLQHVNLGYVKIPLVGLDPDSLYHVSIHDRNLYGDELMNVGFSVSDAMSGENKEKYNGENGDFQSRIYILKKVVN